MEENRSFRKGIAMSALAVVMTFAGCGNTQGSTNVPVEQTSASEKDAINKQENTSTANKIPFSYLDESNTPEGTKQKEMLKKSEVNELRFLDL